MFLLTMATSEDGLTSIGLADGEAVGVVCRNGVMSEVLSQKNRKGGSAPQRKTELQQ